MITHVLLANETLVLVNKDDMDVRNLCRSTRQEIYTNTGRSPYMNILHNTSHPMEIPGNFRGVCFTSKHQVNPTIEEERESLVIAGYWYTEASDLIKQR